MIRRKATKSFQGIGDHNYIYFQSEHLPVQLHKSCKECEKTETKL